MFPTATQEAELCKVCRPFFSASVAGASPAVKSEVASPLPGEIEEAKRNPNGWVYRIAGSFAPNEPVPPEAIVGAWKVDAEGRIAGEFIANKNYDSSRWPSRPV